jgi:hypothetical protein
MDSEQRWHGIPDHLVLVTLRTEESKVVGEAL